MEKISQQGIHKSTGGLIRSSITTRNGIIEKINISGDFFLFPEEALFRIMEELEGIEAKRKEVEDTIERIYIRENIQSPGTTPADFTECIMKALVA